MPEAVTQTDHRVPYRHRGALSWFWRIARWPLGVLLVVVIGCLAVNAVDDSPTPQAQAMLEAPVNTVPDAQNLYVMIAGLDAPPGQSVFEQGQRNILALQRALAAAAPGALISPEIGDTPKAQRMSITPDIGPWPVVHGSVWDQARVEDAHVTEISTRHRELLQRYEALHNAAGYFETLPPDVRVWRHPVPPSLRSLYLASLAQRIRKGSLDEQGLALRSLSADLSMWQRVLLGDGTLISKMITVANIHADLLLLADAMADPTVSVQVVSQSMGPWIAPMPEEQWKIGKVFATEYRFVVGVARATDNSAQYMLGSVDDSTLRSVWNELAYRFFYLPTATLNADAAIMHNVWNISDGDAATLQQRVNAFAQSQDAYASLAFPGVIRNPVGKKLVRIAWPAFTRYPMRAFDVAALQRAVVLTYQIRLQGIAPADVPGFMREHPEWSMHPVGPTPLQWDSKAGAIKVPQQESGNLGQRFEVRVLPPG
jgi:hypothetical protein